MRLFTFGDSWTEGVGGNLKEENTTNIPEERTKIRQKYCWPKHLSDLLQIDLHNFGVGGFSNKQIFDLVSKTIHDNTLQKDDLVIIMWSSSLRDSLPFFPVENPWHFWSEAYMGKKHILQFLFNKKQLYNQDHHKGLKIKYKEFFIENLFSNTYYDIVNQNYILYLQFMFREIGIKYIFCDAFDLMVRDNIIKEVDKRNLINQDNYWGFATKTFKDVLRETNRKDVWEDGKIWDENIKGGKHPSSNGYEVIAKELYNWILEKKLLNSKMEIRKTLI